MSSILKTYNRKNISFKKKRLLLICSKWKKYLDFVQGIAVNCLGHSNKTLIKAINTIQKSMARFECIHYPGARKVSKKTY